MKKIFTSVCLTAAFFFSGCSSLKNIGDYLSEADAVNAIREALIIGSNFGVNSLGQHGSFSRDVLLNAVLPQEAQKLVQTLDRLGLAAELNRFTNTLDNAAVQAVTRSGPIFVDGIRRMSIRDAINIVKNGGTAATDYLRRTVGDTLRGTVRPVMRTALDEYGVQQSWDKLVAPAKILLGNRLGMNLDLDNVMAVIVTNAMFSKIEQQEIEIRTNAQARTSASLRRVFGRDWNLVRN
ncbi:DUF4197 domain-containing protein [Sediminibacterium soli]|uniref:DUF4197 domain-containing protein n=1 Tax=Sediminibacterium soli TaxID=2698829 RepID=UPI001379DE16|nr:DUF4197 domain-containing protein [Sediminibacterium soli]NCI47393.1 DUF4197 domain-containing protein [Sediminibacterium soli]